MTSIGESLRQERLRRDLDLEQISRELKISSRFLEAIEDERFEKLPGGVFAKSFVRQYARYLGLDDDEYAAAVQHAVQPQGPPAAGETPNVPPVEIALPKVEEWQSIGERRINWSSSLPALALVVVAMLVCSGVYTFWQRSRRTAANREEKPQATQSAGTRKPASQTPPQQAPPPQTAMAQAAPQQSAAGQTAPKAEPAAQQPAVPGALTAAAGSPPVTPSNAPPAANSANRPATDAAAPVTPAPDASVPGAAVKVEISATDAVWVQAKADGKVLFSGTIDANQKRTIEAKEKVTLRLGNAGGAEITLNGKPVGPVGPKGQVRTVQFTSGGFQIVAAPKSPAPLDPLF